MSEIENVDEPEVSDVATAGSNVRKDLNEFQEKHATLVLTTVKVNSLLLSLFFFFFNFKYFFILDSLCGEIALCALCFAARLLSLIDMNYQCESFDESIRNHFRYDFEGSYHKS